MKKKIRNWIKKKFDLYDIKDLVIGFTCQHCQTWIPNKIVVLKKWILYTCESCLKKGKK